MASDEAGRVEAERLAIAFKMLRAQNLPLDTEPELVAVLREALALVNTDAPSDTGEVGRIRGLLRERIEKYLDGRALAPLAQDPLGYLIDLAEKLSVPS
jgi:hypothetical protein